MTLIFIAITSIISFIAFNNASLLDRLLLWPAKMRNHPLQFYRLLTAGFVHADTIHLLFNMITLYYFGTLLEKENPNGIGTLNFSVLYITGIVISCIPSFLKHRYNPSYRSLGASGGVAAIVFAMIYIYPWEGIYIFFIPIPIPSILYAVIYLVYTYYMARNNRGYINHDAHLWGSIYGIVFMIATDPSHGQHFLKKILHS